MNDLISILSMNIGNPSIERAKKQCAWLENRNEDIFILTETKASKGCEYISEYFSKFGCDLFTLNSGIQYEVNYPISQTKDLGVMILSRKPILKSTNHFSRTGAFYSRQTTSKIIVNNKTIDVIGLYVPSRDRSELKIARKKKFISGVLEYLNSGMNNTIIIGDFNILDRAHIPHYSTFFDWEYDFYDSIIEKGFLDAFRYCHPKSMEYSWVGRTNNGYRYDYCFISTDLKNRLRKCDFIHETRMNRLTDHSAIRVELTL